MPRGAGDAPLRVLWRSAFAAPDANLLPPGCRLHVEPDLDRALALRDEIDVLVDGRESALLDGAALSRVIVPFAGLPGALRDALLQRPHLRVHNAHYNAPFVAQHALALLLAAAHHLAPIDAALRRGDWGDRRDPVPSRHLAGGEALLLGYGAIGRHLAPMLRGLGMRVTALRRSPEGDDREVRQVGREALDDALGRADAVIVALPATADTSAMLDRAALGRLRPRALVVNVGRSSIFDEDALFEGLSGGRIGAAGIDVWWRYPEEAGTTTLPAHRPFWTLPNVVLSPHRADASDDTDRARHEDVAATLRAILEGRERSRVDVALGY